MKTKEIRQKLLALGLAFSMVFGYAGEIFADTTDANPMTVAETQEVSGSDQEKRKDAEGQTEISAQEEGGTVSLAPLEASQEEYDSFDLQELRFYLLNEQGEEEISPDKEFRRDVYDYKLRLPRETKKMIVKARAVTNGAKIIVPSWPQNVQVEKEPDQDGRVEVEFPSYNVNEGAGLSFWIKVVPSNPPNVTYVPSYLISVQIEGHPKPEIQGFKQGYVFTLGEIVTREDLLQGVRAVDEIEGDLTDKIEVIPSVGWYKGKLDTRFLHEGDIIFRVINSRGRVFNQSVKLKIVKEKPEDQDVIPPVFEGLESKTFYVGEFVDRQRLLEGVKAVDDVDGDITDRIILSKDTILTQEEKEENISYQVRDGAGNETYRIIKHRVIERPLDIEQNDEKIRQLVRTIAPRYYATGQDWEAVNLAIAGKAEFIHTQTLLTKAQEVMRQEPRKATEYERIILSLTAAGLDARNIPDGNGSKIDLIDKITSFETMGTINDYIWALQALDSGKYSADKRKKWNRETLVNYLLEKQLSDGSWN